MKIDRIAYEQLYPTGVYANQRYRAEATIEEGDDIQKCYSDLQQCVNRVFNELNPQIQWEQPMFHPPTQEEQPTDKIDSFISTINYCTTKKFLENFKKRVDDENVPKLTEAYYKKLKTFQ